MSIETPVPDDCRLVFHAVAIRRLAQQLVRDDARADDVAQETMRVGLERRPAPGWPLGAWLRGVARNVARNLAREERRRGAREAAAARPEGQPSTAEAVARVEQHRRLAQAVLALPEPFRGAVAMRYFDGLAPRVIAKRTGVPVATVRSRLRRGIELLRADLDHRHGGDRRAWVIALVPLARRAPGERMSDILGGLVMGTAAKVATAAVVVGIGLLAWWRPWNPDSGTGPKAGGETSSGSAMGTGGAGLAVRPSPSRPDRGVEGSRDSTQPRPATIGPTIRGHVVDAAGHGIAGARVFATADTASETFDVDDPVNDRRPTFAITDVDGSFSVEARGRAPLFDVVAVAKGFAARAARGVRADADTTIRLVPGPRLVGRVLSLDGDPVGGALVSLRDVLGVATVSREAVSAADGRYEIANLPDTGAGSAHRSILVKREGFAPLLYNELGRRWSDTEDWTLDLVLGRGSEVVARIVDDETGAPIEGARVVLWSIEGLMSERRASGVSVRSPTSPVALGEEASPADGTVRFSHVPAEGFHHRPAYNAGKRGKTMGYVGAWKSGWAWAADEVPVAAEGSTIACEIRLRRPATIAGRVVEPDGSPVEGATIWGRVANYTLMTSAPEFLAKDVPSPRAVTDADGKYVIAGVPALASGSVSATVEAASRRENESDAAPPPRRAKQVVAVRAGERVTAPDLVLEPPRASGLLVTLVVTDAAGAPVWGASIDRARPAFTSPYYGVRSGADGRLRLHFAGANGERPGDAYVVRAPGHAPALVTVASDVKDGAEIPVALGLSHRLAGRVRRADNSPAQGASILVFGAAPSPTAPPQLGSAKAEDDGSFVVSDLPNGPFDVHASTSWAAGPADGSPGTGARPGVVADTANVEITLSPEAPKPRGRLLGSVEDADTGRPIALFDVTISIAGADASPPTPRLAQSDGRGQTLWSFPSRPSATRTSVGRFVSEGLEPGDYEIVVRAAGYLLTRLEHVAFSDGTVELPSIRLSRGVRVHRTVTLPAGTTAQDRSLAFAGPLPLAARESAKVPLSANGEYSASGLVPGRYRVTCATPSSWFDPSAPPVLIALDDVVVPDRVADVDADVALAVAGSMSIMIADPRLPSLGAQITQTQRDFGRESKLGITSAAGRVIASADSLEYGVPREVSFLVAAPGAYTVRLSMPGGETVEERVELEPGKTADVKLGGRK